MKVELEFGRRVSWTRSYSHEGSLDAGPLYNSLITHGLVPYGSEFSHTKGCLLYKPQLRFELDKKWKLIIVSVGKILVWCSLNML